MLNRRRFLTLSAVGLAANGRFPVRAQGVTDQTTIKALAFDAFAIFDPRPIFLECEETFPGRGTELSALWRTRQFEYQWLRALSGKYEDFWSSTRSALEFASRSLALDLSATQRDRLMAGYLSLKPWPEVPAALCALRRSGRQMIILSNATQEILASGIRVSGLEGLFLDHISTDRIKTFKPDPRAYQLGVERLRLPREKILFVAFAGWDTAGSKWFGYPTFWNNRQRVAAEVLGATPDGVGESLDDLVRFLG